MNPLVEIGAIRVYASAFCVFSGVSWADKRPAPNYPRYRVPIPNPFNPRNPWSKKFSRFEIVQELRREFPGKG
jgi:hypothetical protein